MKKRLSLLALIVTVFALVLVVAGPTLAQSAGSMFDYVIARKLLVRGTTSMVGAVTTSGDVTVGDDLAVTDDAAVTGDLDVTGSLEVTGGVTGDITGDVTGDLTGDVTGNVTGDITGTVTGNVTGDLTGNVTGNVTGDLTGNVTADDWMRISPQTVITVTAAGEIAPTGSFQLLTAAADVGTSDVVTTTTAGRLLWLLNTSAFTITLTDTAPLELSGDLVLSPGDTAGLISQDSKWYQLSGEAN